MKKMIIMTWMLLLSGQAMAVCQTTTITASTPDADFIVNGDGTVTHSKTGLMWKQCSEGLSGAGCTTGTASMYTWQEALQLVKSINNSGGFAGYTDWRLPNIKELASIFEEQCNLPSINTTIFPATVSSSYWTASPYTFSKSAAWYVAFGIETLGSTAGRLMSASTYVRLVRGGQ